MSLRKDYGVWQLPCPVSKQAYEIYSCLAQQPEPVRAAFIAQQLGVHTPAVYRAINQLVRKGLVIRRVNGSRISYVCRAPRNAIAAYSDISMRTYYQWFAPVLASGPIKDPQS